MSSVYKWLNKEKARFYTVTIVKDIPNEIILNHRWGGCNSNRGGKKNISVGTEEELKKCINKMMKRRKSRGYELVTHN